jgi:crotonobetainyl-CoA:carnitine CoA-transferase CaiB-like acyl-CoA transferase
MCANLEKEQLLDGVRVIDLADEKGVFCSRLLADLGADVIKVEKPGGDASRNIGPFLGDDPHPEKSLYFAYTNANKKSVTLNLNMSLGQQIFKKLCESADIVVEAFSPGYLAELGLDYPKLAESNQGIILTSITGFGQTGPYKDFKVPEIVAQAMGGVMHQIGNPGMAPLQIGGLQIYYVVSLFAAVATLIALFTRNATGLGQHVDVSMQECIAAILEFNPFYFYSRDSKDIIQRLGSRYFTACPANIYPCKDGYIYLFMPGGGPVGGSPRWTTLIAWIIDDGIDVGDLADPEYEADVEKRIAMIDKVDAAISQWSSLYTRAEIFEKGQRRGIPLVPMASIGDVVKDIQLNARGLFTEVFHPIIGKVKYPRIPYHWETPKEIRHAPLIGQHNKEVYGEFGFSKEDLVVLKGTGVI